MVKMYVSLHMGKLVQEKHIRWKDLTVSLFLMRRWT